MYWKKTKKYTNVWYAEVPNNIAQKAVHYVRAVDGAVGFTLWSQEEHRKGLSLLGEEFFYFRVYLINSGALFGALST